MKNIATAIRSFISIQAVFTGVLSALFLLLPAAFYGQTKEILSNQTVISLVKNGKTETEVIAKIRSSDAAFDTSNLAVKTMEVNGVSKKIIMLIMERSGDAAGLNEIRAEVISSGKQFILEDKTPVKLKTKSIISSADAKSGETISLEVVEDVEVDQIVVIRKGAIAYATITAARPKGSLGKSGKLEIIIDGVRLVSGDKAPLRVLKESKGDAKRSIETESLVGANDSFFSSASSRLLLKGKDVIIPQNTEIVFYINGNQTLVLEKFIKPAKM